VWGAIIGGALDLGGQIAASRAKGKSWYESITDVSVLSVATSAAQGALVPQNTVLKVVNNKYVKGGSIVALEWLGNKLNVSYNSITGKKDGSTGERSPIIEPSPQAEILTGISLVAGEWIDKSYADMAMDANPFSKEFAEKMTDVMAGIWGEGVNAVAEEVTTEVSTFLEEQAAERKRINKARSKISKIVKSKKFVYIYDKGEDEPRQYRKDENGVYKKYTTETNDTSSEVKN